MSMVKGWSLIEIAVVYVVSFLLSRLLVVVLDDFLAMERQILGYNYLFNILIYTFPLLIVKTRNRDFKSYGFTTEHWKFDLDVAMSVFVFAIIPFLIGYVFIASLGFGMLDPLGALIITGFMVITLVIILKVLEKKDIDDIVSPHATKVNLIMLVVLPFVPLIIAISTKRYSPEIIAIIAWQFLISGFGEEIKYRGYYQSTVNLEFGRPYTIAGIQFGPGLIISSFLFSLSHVLNPFNPFIGSLGLSAWWGTFTFVSGFTFGMIREKTGSILAPGIYHGLPDAVGEAIASVFGLN